MGVFNLIKYKNREFDPLKDFKNHGIEEKKVNWLLEVDENILKKVYEGTYESDAI